MLNVNNLNVCIDINGNSYDVLNDISFSVDKRHILGLVGESGCGKSMTANAIMGYLRNNIKITSGSIMLNDIDLAKYTEKDYENIRGTKISMIFQDSIASLNPLMKIGKQIGEAYKIHYKLSKHELKEKVIMALENVGFTNPLDTINKYPHNLSGGQRQRVMIAMAIACDPTFLIADEPTTALDVTTQNKILSLIKNIQNKNDMGVILISHDITVINQMCTHVCVMYSGKIVEYGYANEIVENPKHPYTKALIASIPNTKNKNKELNVIKGYVPALDQRNNQGCIFYDRCKFRNDKCKEDIKTIDLENNRKVACTLYY
ncbi:ABC transporter ATP-binding protein [Sedimentibacter sp. zth1]|uniref:ABC transporter ATP-binding protein n=1 Tax=Sedimentibacter sp. zth1 TaxID=2816908 RepID=UPI001A937A0E|nr:ABC transporter ATP-binding protein [Sedimentibacter sp. zth1]QSX05361.1 ABC transporter ATP-binding protein [Sedimentibacter sp. zth1]